MSDALHLFLICLSVSLFTVGGGGAMLPLIQANMVDTGFMTVGQSIDLIAIAQMTPGPLAINAATFAGMQVGGFWVAALATLGMILPSLVLTMLAAYFFERFRRQRVLMNVMDAVRPLVPALIALSLWVLIESALMTPAGFDWAGLAIAVITFAILYTKKVGAIWLILISAVLGALLLQPGGLL